MTIARKSTDLSSYIGDIGAYQWRVVAAIFLFVIFTADSIHIVFIGANMDHWCRVEALHGLPADVQKRLSIPAAVTSSPVVGGGDADSTVEYSKCEMYASNYSSYLLSMHNDTEMLMKLLTTNETRRNVVPCTQGWNYDTSTFQSTIVKKFDLVCGWGFLRQFVSTAFMAGVLVGAVSSGAISDRFGRKKTMVAYCVIKILGNLMSIFSPYYIPFVIGRLLMGVGEIGYFLPSFVLVMELIGPKYRPVLGTALQIAFSIGIMIQPAIAYFLRDEVRFQIAIGAPTIVFPFLMFLVIPESPRWLAVHGRFDDVTKLVTKICETNGLKLAPNFDPACFVEKRKSVEPKTCSALLTSPVMRVRTFIIDFSWMTCSLIYYALAFNVGTLHGNIYLNTFLSGAVEIPAYIVCVLLMDWRILGRRWSGCILLVGAGVSSFLCIPFILYHYVRATVFFAMCGKAFICAAYSIVYVYASEIFPTEVRNVGVGTASMCSRITAMIAHYAGGSLADVWTPLPSLVFGIFASVAGALYTRLPETLGQQLPDTIEQAELQSTRTCSSNRIQDKTHDSANGSLQNSPTTVSNGNEKHAADAEKQTDAIHLTTV